MRRPKLRNTALLLIALVGAVGAQSAGAARSSTSIESTPLIWPGRGRMLSAPLVIGNSTVGQGSLEVVDGKITTTTARIDDAPPELSLRMFTFVTDAGSGGYSAVLRYRVPIVQLHAWRGHAVRMTQTIILRPPSPSDQARAVQLQADGTAAIGTYRDGQFAATDAGSGRIDGNVSVIAVPASIGVTPEWTVQALIEVMGDEPLNASRPATGYAAGTSIVPVGYLTGDADATAISGVADAVTALTSAEPASADVPDGLRVTDVRVEGDGPDLVVVVTTAAPPTGLPTIDRPTIRLSLVAPGFASLDHPVGIAWFGSAGTTDANIGGDGLTVASSVPVTVSGNEVRFALGQSTPGRPLGTPPVPRLDTLHDSVDVTLHADGDVISSVDGVTAVPTEPDTVTLTFDGPQLSVRRASTGSLASGFVDVDGNFVALNDTEHYAGVVDRFGSVMLHTSRLQGGVVTGVGVSGDYTTSDFDATRAPPVLERSLAFVKGVPPLMIEILPRLYASGWLSVQLGAGDGGSFTPPASGVAQSSGAQGGLPDWPLIPLAAEASTEGTFMVQVTAGTFPDGLPIELHTPWMESSTIAAPAETSPTEAPTATPSSGPTTSTGQTATSTAVPRRRGGDSSGRAPFVFGGIAVLVGSGGWLAVSRKRRKNRLPLVAPGAPPTVRVAAGPTTHRISDPAAGWSIGARASLGTTTHSARETEPETDAP